ncbi:MAG: RNase adapter RapZ [Actinobacteria bacterium]|nr:RNase adapter RapZ [Actinomycetota bacterium]
MEKSEGLKTIIITGLSGAGRTLAMRCFEDAGYFCIDNLPSSLILDLINICSLPGSKIDKLALVIDVRSRDFFDQLPNVLKDLNKKNIDYQILFLSADEETLVKRFKETRRTHPLAKKADFLEGIRIEKGRIKFLRETADIVIDTSHLTPMELKNRINNTIILGLESKRIQIQVVSFGYSLGIPQDADLVMDVRFLPNPNYVESLRLKSGLDKEVYDFVISKKGTTKFLNIFKKLLSYTIPKYILEGKNYLKIAIGCTGGRHRSAVIAKEIFNFLKEQGYEVIINHRDLQ